MQTALQILNKRCEEYRKELELRGVTLEEETERLREVGQLISQHQNLPTTDIAPLSHQTTSIKS